MEIDSPIQAGEYEINIMDEAENTSSKETVKRMKWETISGGSSSQSMSYDFSEIDESCEKRVLSSSRISSNVGRPIPRRERKWKPDYDSDIESDSNLSDIENLQIEPTSQLRFNLDWVTAICHIKERKSVITNVKKPPQIKVIYQFYYQNRARVLNETRSELRCIWCEKQFYNIQDLLAHLKASHDRFLYSTPESKAIDSKMKISTIHIEVYPNPWKIHSYLGNPNLSESLDIGRCIFYRGSEPIKRTNTKGTQILIWRRRAIHPSAQPDEKGTLDRTECSLITQGHRRLYFHTHSNMPVRACEFEVDSEDDSQQEFRWIRDNMFNQINEFTDVNKDEKLVMQLWNHFLMSRKVLSLPQIAQACIDIRHVFKF